MAESDSKTIILPDSGQNNNGWGGLPVSIPLTGLGLGGYPYGNYGGGLFGSGSGFGAGILGGLLGGLIWGGIGNGWGGWGNNGNGAAAASLGAQATANNNAETILRAIDGTDSDVRLLATTLNSDVNTVKTNLSYIQNGLTQLSGQTGLSAQQIINAIQSGDASLASQLCQCCCEMRQLTVEQGYQNQIRTLEQTNALSNQADRNTASITAAIGAQTTMINEKFCDLEKREMQATIDRQADVIGQLRNAADNAAQTNQIMAYVGSVVTPLAKEVNDIKCKLPETVSVPYPQLSVVNTTPNFGNNYGPNYSGFGWGNGFFGGFGGFGNGFGGNIVF